MNQNLAPPSKEIISNRRHSKNIDLIIYKRKYSIINQNGDTKQKPGQKASGSNFSWKNRSNSFIIEISKLVTQKGSEDDSFEGAPEEIIEKSNESNNKSTQRRIHKTSEDITTKSASNQRDNTFSMARLKSKAEEVKNNNGKNRVNSTTVNDIFDITEPEVRHKDSNVDSNVTPHMKKRRIESRQERTDSGYVDSDILGESVMRPEVIDNSAIMFSNTKRKKDISNRLGGMNAHPDRSENDFVWVSMPGKGDKKYGIVYSNEDDRSEGEYNGEGESYSSSCSCSSCLREKNADNGVSLKLSQYSYFPPGSQYPRETDGESNFVGRSGYQDDDNQGKVK